MRLAQALLLLLPSPLRQPRRLLGRRAAHRPHRPALLRVALAPAAHPRCRRLDALPHPHRRQPPRQPEAARVDSRIVRLARAAAAHLRPRAQRPARVRLRLLLRVRPRADGHEHARHDWPRGHSRDPPYGGSGGAAHVPEPDPDRGHERDDQEVHPGGVHGDGHGRLPAVARRPVGRRRRHHALPRQVRRVAPARRRRQSGPQPLRRRRLHHHLHAR
mmetsp:Transcript_29623/g.81391  ORF Transcript_29623/g.81391 Transcript_29623/m.81391 type:complete len:217 (-) Transcript_29623:760-1410(-)